MSLNKKNLIFILIFVFVIGGISGYFVGVYLNERAWQVKINKIVEKFPTEGNSLVKKTPDEIKTIRGIIERVEDNKIIIRVDPSSNPFEEWPLKREIYLTENVKLYKRIVKSSQDYEKEKKEFEKNQIGEYPKPYNDVEIKIEEFKDNLTEGNSIVISSDENIKFLEKITPISILIL